MKKISEVAKSLAEAHRKADPKTLTIKWFPSSQDEIKLLEVSESVPTTGEVLSIWFAAAPQQGIDYPSRVILLSLDEWKSVQSNTLLLPVEWDLLSAQDL